MPPPFCGPSGAGKIEVRSRVLQANEGGATFVGSGGACVSGRAHWAGSRAASPSLKDCLRRSEVDGTFQPRLPPLSQTSDVELMCLRPARRFEKVIGRDNLSTNRTLVHGLRLLVAAQVCHIYQGRASGGRSPHSKPRWTPVKKPRRLLGAEAWSPLARLAQHAGEGLGPPWPRRAT